LIIGILSSPEQQTGVYPETPIDYASDRIISGVKNLREGLNPDILAYWYKRVEDRSREIVPPHLKDKVHFEQDRILWMKFKMDVSKRAVPYVMQVIEEYIPSMPYSTGLYFRKVQEILTDEINKELR
jgi:hypothetical protein